MRHPGTSRHNQAFRLKIPRRRLHANGISGNINALDSRMLTDLSTLPANQTDKRLNSLRGSHKPGRAIVENTRSIFKAKNRKAFPPLFRREHFNIHTHLCHSPGIARVFPPRRTKKTARRGIDKLNICIALELGPRLPVCDLHQTHIICIHISTAGNARIPV